MAELLHRVDENGIGVECLGDLSSSSSERKIDTPDNQLLEAVVKGDLNSAQNALVNGANLHMRSECKYTPLMHAVDAGNWEMLSFLLAKGGNINDETYNVLEILCNSTCTDDMSLLNCLNALLDNGADPSATDWTGATPLIHAVRKNREILASRLITAGCSVNAPDSDGWTPLFYAVQNNNISIAQLLVDCGAKINLMDQSGRTPCQIAASTNNRDLIKMMTTELEPECSLTGTDPRARVGSLSRKSPFKRILEIGPKLNDRQYGFHSDAIAFLRGIGLEYVASVMSTKNLQFADLLTWSEDEWSEAGIRLSYQKNKIRTCVQRYHEKEWGRDAIPDMSQVYEHGKVDLFKVVQVLADLVRMTHITAASSLYLVKNYDKEQITPDVADEILTISIGLEVIKQQIPLILDTCLKLEETTNVLPPDFIPNSKRNLKVRSSAWKFGCIASALVLAYFLKKKLW